MVYRLMTALLFNPVARMGGAGPAGSDDRYICSYGIPGRSRDAGMLARTAGGIANSPARLFAMHKHVPIAVVS